MNIIDAKKLLGELTGSVLQNLIQPNRERGNSSTQAELRKRNLNSPVSHEDLPESKNPPKGLCVLLAASHEGNIEDVLRLGELLDPKSLDDSVDRARYYGAVGEALLRKGCPTAAVECLTKGMRSSKDSRIRRMLLNNRAGAFMDLGFFKEARQDLNEALKTKPADLPALYNLLALASRQRSKRSVAPAYRRLQKYHPAVSDKTSELYRNMMKDSDLIYFQEWLKATDKSHVWAPIWNTVRVSAFAVLITVVGSFVGAGKSASEEPPPEDDLTLAKMTVTSNNLDEKRTEPFLVKMTVRGNVTGRPDWSRLGRV